MSDNRNIDVSIPCLVLTHGRSVIIEESLASIMACDPRLSIDIVHNPSTGSEENFLQTAREWVTSGKVRSLTIFDENISNNAVILYLLKNLDRYGADRILITDGDIVAPTSTIEEEMAILDRHTDVLACGLRPDASAWDDALTIKKDLVDRFNTTRFEAADYVDTATGMWMTMFRGPEFVSIFRTLHDNNMRLTDANMKQIGAALFQKKCVATKTSIGRELNRERPDYYATKAVSTHRFRDHSPETNGSRYSTWNHDRIAPATEWRGGRERRVNFDPLPPAVARFRGALEGDPVIRAIGAGELNYSSGYLANHLIRAISPGLAFVVSQDPCPTGLPRLASDRSAIFVSVAAEAGPQIVELERLDCGPVMLAIKGKDCLSLLVTMSRFMGSGTTLEGLAFRADAVRQQLQAGDRTALAHFPRALRSTAASADMVDRLWSDELLARWLGESATSLQLRRSVKNPHLVHFEATLARTR